MSTPFKILFSNDTTNIINGPCGNPYCGDPDVFTREKMNASVDEVAELGVDVHLLQPGFSWIPWYESDFYTREEHAEWFKQRFPDKTPGAISRYWLQGGDVVGDFVARCADREQTRFVSMRMNHNPFPGKEENTASRFTDGLPEESLLGRPPFKCTADWKREDVREHRFTQIREICEKYDLDGFELDFMRYVRYYDCDVTTLEERREITTGFVKRVRELLDRTAKPGQHRWLSVRIPSEVEPHHTMGLDVQALAEAGVEVFNLSCYYFSQQQNDLAQICELVPQCAVYQEVTYCSSRNTVISGTRDGTVPTDVQLRTASVRRLTNEHQIYTTAYLAQKRGAKGLSFFNFVYYRFYDHEPPFHVMSRITDMEWLAEQPQWYFVDDHAFCYAQSSYRGMLPKEFSEGASHTFSLDLAPTAILKTGILRLMTVDDSSECKWEVTMNGKPLDAIEFVRNPLPNPYSEAQGDEKQYACFNCPVECLRDGVNEMDVKLIAGPQVNLRYLDLVLK